MSDAFSFIRISVDRLQTGKVFAREVYLNLPKNDKMVCLVLIGDEIRPDLLERLKNSSPIIFARTEPGDPDSPSLFPLYREIAPNHLKPESETVQSVKNGNAEEQSTILSAGKPQTDDVKAFSPESVAPVESKNIAGEAEITGTNRVSSSLNPETFEENLSSASEIRPLSEEKVPGQNGPPSNLTLITNSALSESSTVLSSDEITEKLTRLLKTVEAQMVPPFLEELMPVQDVLKNSIQIMVNQSGQTTLASSQLVSESLLEAAGALSGSDLLKNMPGARDLCGELEAVSALAANLQVAAQRTSSGPDNTDSKSTIQSLSQAMAYRDLPQIAGRMATYLGHSIGYNDYNYLSDLALATVLHFSKKNGLKVEEGKSPKLAQRVLSDSISFNDATVVDARDIIFFLTSYFEFPECDRTQKDFSLRTFEGVAEKLREQNSTSLDWSISRWEQFVSKGPTLGAHSLCSKATARAIKESRPLVGEA